MRRQKFPYGCGADPRRKLPLAKPNDLDVGLHLIWPSSLMFRLGYLAPRLVIVVLIVLTCCVFASFMLRGPLSTDTAAWLQALGAIAAICTAWKLQDRGHALARQAAHRDRLEALNVIAKQCERTLRIINGGVANGKVSQKQLAYWRDELEADLEVLRGLDLISLGSEAACDAVVRLRRNLTTARRRLRLVEERIAEQKPLGASDFIGLVEQVKETRQRVAAAR